jgi:transposase
MERRKFTREFKLEAVRLIKERGVSYAQASEDLGVHQSQLRGWVKALADDPQHAFPGPGQMKPEQLEIAQLKSEVIRLKAERDILKKAAVDSTGERNMIGIMSSRRIRNGADGSAWFVVAAEARAMGTVESGPFVERYWPWSRQACRINLRRVALKGRHRTFGKSSVATVSAARSVGIMGPGSIGRPMLMSELGGPPVVLNSVVSLSIHLCRWWLLRN